MKHSTTFEDWIYVFAYEDKYWSVVTDGKSIEELWSNIREAMSLHYDGVSWNEQWVHEFEFSVPLTLSFSQDWYAAHLQNS